MNEKGRKKKERRKRKKKERIEVTKYVNTLYVAYSNYRTEFKAEIFPLNVFERFA
jgi:hypothetical protein